MHFVKKREQEKNIYLRFAENLLEGKEKYLNKFKNTQITPTLSASLNQTHGIQTSIDAKLMYTLRNGSTHISTY